MPWIQKNLTLVLGGLLGLVLLGGSGFFLYSQLRREAEANLSLEEMRNEWMRLNSLNPYPDDRNIQSIKEESERLAKIAAALRDQIRPVEVPPVHDTFSLRLLVEDTISELTREAELAGVALPDRYAFTFQRLREIGGQFDSNAIPRLAEQVSHVSKLFQVLFDAKVHALDTFRRSAVLKDEGGGSDYLSSKPATNRWVIRIPYDLSFRSHSAELARVIDGLASLDECVVIKTLNVEPTTFSSPASQNTYMPMPSRYMPSPAPGSAGGAPGGMDPALAARYGLVPGGRNEDSSGAGGMTPELRARYGLDRPGAGGGGLDPRYGLGNRYGGGANRYGGMGAPGAEARPLISTPAPNYQAAPAGQPVQRSPATMLNEQPIRVILQLDFVKPVPAGENQLPDDMGSAYPMDASSDGSTDGSDMAY